MTVEKIKALLDACYQAKRARELLERLGLEKGKSIYRQFEEDPDRFLFVSDPARAVNIWKNYIP